MCPFYGVQFIPTFYIIHFPFSIIPIYATEGSVKSEFGAKAPGNRGGLFPGGVFGDGIGEEIRH